MVLDEKQAKDRVRLLEAAQGEERDLHDSLREWVYESHKDFYGTKGRWAMTATSTECADWIVRHFSFNEAQDLWEFRAEMMEAA
jgi:hypothetical protein